MTKAQFLGHSDFVLRHSLVIGHWWVIGHSQRWVMGRAAWILVGVLWAVAVLNYLDRQLLVNMAKPIKSDLGIANEHFGLFSSMFLWVYGVCSPLAGYLADRVGRKPVIIASLGVWSAATLYTGFVTSFEEML